ncbi:MAG: hypothetical protein EZS28_053547, partial [Streblomastix strix]
MIRVTQLKGERRRLIQASDAIVKDFDSKLDELRKSRFRLAAEMCSAELRLVTLFEEL